MNSVHILKLHLNIEIHFNIILPAVLGFRTFSFPNSDFVCVSRTLYASCTLLSLNLIYLVTIVLFIEEL